MRVSAVLAVLFGACCKGEEKGTLPFRLKCLQLRHEEARIEVDGRGFPGCMSSISLPSTGNLNRERCGAYAGWRWSAVPGALVVSALGAKSPPQGSQGQKTRERAAESAVRG
jgi:hypothetical protein